MTQPYRFRPYRLQTGHVRLPRVRHNPGVARGIPRHGVLAIVLAVVVGCAALAPLLLRLEVPMHGLSGMMIR